MCIRDRSGDVSTLNVNYLDTIGKVKDQIEDKLGHSVDEQILTYADKEMSDECSVTDYNIQEGSILVLHLRKNLLANKYTCKHASML